MSKTETGVQLLARLGARPSLDGLEDSLFNNGPNAGDVFEFYGEEGVGKTQLLLHFIAKIILPKTWKTHEIGGCGARVIFIDTDYKFQITTLVNILENRVKSLVLRDSKEVSQTEQDEIHTFVQSCLSNLLVARCRTSENLICTLHGLVDILNVTPEIGIIMLDSISTFYYVDKSNSTLDSNMNNIINILTQLIEDFKLSLFVTKAALVKRKVKTHEKGDNSVDQTKVKGEDLYQYAEFLGSKWHSFVQKRFILLKETISNPTKYSVYCKHFKNPKYFTITENGVEF